MRMGQSLDKQVLARMGPYLQCGQLCSKHIVWPIPGLEQHCSLTTGATPFERDALDQVSTFLASN